MKDSFEHEFSSHYRLALVANFYRKVPLDASGQHIRREFCKGQRCLVLDGIEVRKLHPDIVLNKIFIVSGIEEVDRHGDRNIKHAAMFPFIESPFAEAREPIPPYKLADRRIARFWALV